MAKVQIGVSGWKYASWRGDFYPTGLRQKDELALIAQHMNSAEINGSFYSLQSPSSYLNWRQQTPAHFTFAVKGSRYISHMLKLRNIDQALANFFASGVLALEEKLGPILWQLPEHLHFHPELLQAFFAKLPTSTGEAAKLGAAHDERLKRGAWLATEEDRPLRYALEVRHPSYDTAHFYDLLREQNVASVVADTAGRFPMLLEDTADFTYWRLHGGEQLYFSDYSPSSLDRWAADMKKLSAGKDLHAYFDNDALGHAPHDAVALAKRFDQ